MTDMQFYGLAMMLGVAVFVMLLTLRGQPKLVWFFASVLVALGLGYLSLTPAPAEIAAMMLGSSEVKVVPAQ